MSPKVSILVVSWNSWNDLERLLASTRALEFRDFEVLVVDNGSEDGTPERVLAAFPEVRLERIATNLGLPPAVNRGFRLARGRFVMLFDVDTEVAPDAVDRLAEFMEAHPEVSLAAPRIHDSEGNIEESARSFPTLASGLFGRRALLTRVFPRNRFSQRYLRRDHLDSRGPLSR